MKMILGTESPGPGWEPIYSADGREVIGWEPYPEERKGMETCVTPARRAADEKHAQEALLCHSPIACAAGDLWCSIQRQYARRADANLPPEGPIAWMGGDECAIMSALELATRESPLRKVKP